MGKGKVCVGVICICILILFGVMIYLINGINPPPIVSEDSEVKDTKDSNELKFENVIFDDVPPTVEVLQYGLEKIDNEHLDYSTYVPDSLLKETESFNNLWKYAPQKGPSWSTTTAVVRKRAPIFQTIYKTTTPYNTVVTWDEASLYNETASKNGINISTKNHTSIIVPVKRSVRDFKKYGGDGVRPTIILKILDDNKQFKIEIKLGPIESRRKRYRENKNSLKNRSKSKKTLQSHKNNEWLLNELAKNTIISVMPNHSIVVNEYDYGDDSNDESKVKKIFIDKNIKVNEIRNVADDQNSTYRNISDYENIIFNETENNNTNISDVQIITDYRTILFNHTKKFESNISHVQNITDNEHILSRKVDFNRNVTTNMPIYKNVFTLNVLFGNNTKSIHSDAEKRKSLHNNATNKQIKNHLSKGNNESDGFDSDFSNSSTKSNVITKDLHDIDYLHANAENSTKISEYLVAQILPTENSTSKIETDDVFATVIESTLQHETSTVESINITTQETHTTNTDDDMLQAKKSTTAIKNNVTMYNENFINQNITMCSMNPKNVL